MEAWKGIILLLIECPILRLFHLFVIKMTNMNQSEQTEDTIAAISTALNESGIGIIRISGSRALEVAACVYRSKNRRKNLMTVPSHTIHYGFIYDGEHLIDEVLVMVMRAPRTYTGEDTVEIDCHGGIMSMRMVLKTVLEHGARMAQPGEFTKRAFLNGRIDLSKAEAVMDVIQARNEKALQNSLSQLSGVFSEKIRKLREQILYEVAYIESALDDPEHISLEGYTGHIAEVSSAVYLDVCHLLDTAENGKWVREGICTVILGKPNVGKSSLMNRLLGQERAIVSEIAGTTRDTLEEYVNLGDITLHIIDTAGIHESEEPIEKIGIDRARQMAQKAELILFVADCSLPLEASDRDILKMTENKKRIILYNKTDLPTVLRADDLAVLCPDSPIIPVSIKEDKGFDQLIQAIRNLFFAGSISSEEYYVTNYRHRELLIQAKKSLEMVKMAISDGLSEDFFTIDLMDAYESLGKILGESVGEDLVNEIFERFCIGK